MIAWIRSITFFSAIKRLTLSEMFFLIAAMIGCFCVTCEHAIVKPASNSIFLSHFHFTLFPYLWLVMVPVNFLIVTLYGWLISRVGILLSFLLFQVLAISQNVVSAFFIMDSPALSICQTIFKDIYVLLMFQQIWSLIQLKLSLDKAKVFFGIISALGGLGSLVGSIITKQLALRLGSENLLLVGALIYGAFTLIFVWMISLGGEIQEKASVDLKKSSKDPLQGFKDIAGSKYLLGILLLVTLMQLTSTLLEYRFNAFLEHEYPVKDVRTSFTGTVFTYAHVMTMILQLLGSYVFIHILGLRNTHLFVPTLLMATATASYLPLSFPFIPIQYGSLKALDHSLFRISLEMLYLPLPVESKFKAKSVIDVFVYRTSRALASLFVLGLQILVTGAAFLTTLSVIPIVLFAIWMGVVLMIFKEKEAVHFQPEKQQMQQVA